MPLTYAALGLACVDTVIGAFALWLIWRLYQNRRNGE